MSRSRSCHYLMFILLKPLYLQRLIPNWIQKHNLKFSRNPGEVDRAWMIRATSGGRGGDPTLEDENSLRTLINSLLNEGGSTGAKTK